MRLLDGLCRQFLWQMTRVFKLNAVVVNGNTNRTTCIVEKSMAEGIRQGFSQSFSRNFQLLFSRKVNYLSADGKMFEEECHASIQEREEVALGALVVVKLILVCAAETSHAKQELVELAGVMHAGLVWMVCSTD